MNNNININNGNNYNYNKYKESYQNCVKCGKCLPVCPTYNYSLNEFLSPRGRVHLISIEKSGAGPLSVSKIDKALSTCLLCGRCSSVCPNEVCTEILVAEEKAAIRKINNEPLSVSNLVLKILKSKKRLLLQTGLRLSGILKFKNRFVPQPEYFPFITHKDLKFPSKTEYIKVGYFTGCAFNAVYPKISEDTAFALNKNGGSVYVPSSQLCCGLPHISSGDIASFKELAINNALAFKELNLDTIVTSCASCSYSISKLYPLYFNESDKNYRDVIDFAGKLKDIWTFLNLLKKRGGEIKKGELKNKLNAVFHIPCHLETPDDFLPSTINENLIGEAGSIFDKIDALELKPLKHNYCCGNGGMFNIRHYNISKEITKKKFEEIKEASPQIILTSCSGCMFSLQDQSGIIKNDKKLPVKHLIEIYAESLKE